jgi:hypothetical protein
LSEVELLAKTVAEFTAEAVDPPTKATVAATEPGPVAVTSPVRAVIAAPPVALTCAWRFSKAVRMLSEAVIGVLMPVTKPVSNFPVTVADDIEVED